MATAEGFVTRGVDGATAVRPVTRTRTRGQVLADYLTTTDHKKIGTLYLVSGNVSGAFGLAEASYGRPREWGVSASFRARVSAERLAVVLRRLREGLRRLTVERRLLTPVARRVGRGGLLLGLPEALDLGPLLARLRLGLPQAAQRAA